MSGGAFEIGELVIPGRDAREGRALAAALHGALERLWRADRAAGVGWNGELGALSLELDPTLAGERLGEAIAAQLRARAIAPPERGG